MYRIPLSARLFWLLGLIAGLWTGYLLMPMNTLPWWGKAGAAVAVCLGSYWLCRQAVRQITRASAAIDRMMDRIAIESLLGGIAGLLLGLLVGAVSAYPFFLLQGPWLYLTVAIFIGAAYLGLKTGARRAPELLNRWSLLQPSPEAAKEHGMVQYKVLDTSAIIDGRIYDVCLSNFLEGPLIVPTFVIEELQHIADSSDPVRRNKGRRGLELLSKMQKHSAIKIDIIEANISEEKEVDARLVRLCKETDAAIITNDYNLNKVSELQGIKVLNVNELANAVKVMVYPGENMQVTIIKEGREAGQGVAYLEDGTMVVVEEGQYEIGNELEVTVTSVFQTAAGRMIFTRRVKEESMGNGMQPAFSDEQEVNLYG